MDALMTAQKILREFGCRHGLEIGLSPAEPTVIQTAGGLEITLILNEEAGSLEALAVFSPEPEGEYLVEIYMNLLAANLDPDLTRGGSLAIVPETGALVYQQSFDLQGAGPAAFAVFFASLTETASGFRAAINQIGVQPTNSAVPGLKV